MKATPDHPLRLLAGLVGKLLCLPIVFYQRCISPFTPSMA
mgnify:FL=1